MTLAHVPASHSGKIGVLRSSRSVLRYSLFKRLLDVVFVVATAPFTLALVLLLAYLARLDGGKAFYRQTRLGKDGRLFTLWKLRTMVENAETTLQEYLANNPQAKREWDETQKLKNDPRITWVGAYIRKYSLDEIPQLWNVLVGDMSLVGPRPMLPEQASLYPGTAYFALRPGLTGLWQISARNNSPFAGRAEYDTHYANKMSLGVDLWILVLTARVVVRGTGL